MRKIRNLIYLRQVCCPPIHEKSDYGEQSETVTEIIITNVTVDASTGIKNQTIAKVKKIITRLPSGPGCIAGSEIKNHLQKDAVGTYPW